MAAIGKGLLVWRHSLNVQPRTAARFCFTVEDKIYCSAIFVTLELLLMPAHGSSLFGRPAIVANLMLAVVFLCHTGAIT
jgi:hypothetical protein